jgi:peptidoglycan hydrolase CwlO-like protein
MSKKKSEQTDITKDVISVEDLVARYEGEIEELKKENKSLTSKVSYLKNRIVELDKVIPADSGKFMHHG